ncbi:uracil-DNA glycosylase [Fructilactobacillus cliffordii]|uniref:Uracil-DNA glycosylase n=1 Tax=Fructilactobacillus cliffordii TaxID=2940299 RepID=A0A9Q8ZSR2_9LACO|nr:uracil-DNA glycosylase [Fructilactobacillus cliffordii]USS86941.1 uracil-DNA glycosylase [Fructilactobacillus cliffordii]USS88668.1 uracil-DNA glycosylase [Fructilactobacillus cliffordii]
MKRFIDNDWWPILEPEFQKPYYQKLRQFLVNEYRNQTIYPAMQRIFQAFEWTPFSDTKVVILGQDPYHGPHQAIGLSFAVEPNVTLPPSLRNIYKELDNDLGIKPVHHGYLKHWADQGVLLLNSVLTVRDGQAYSHQGHGWEQLTDYAIAKLSERPEPVVFILWGRSARNKLKLIDQETNVVIQSAHPSPLSANRGFFGSRPFSKTNAALTAMGETPIDWQLPEHVTMTN